MITYLKGDATKPEMFGMKVIIHIVNTARKWNSGFVVAVSKRWTEPRAQYMAWNDIELGKVQYVRVESDIVVANMCAQVFYGEGEGPPIRYEALRTCLIDVAKVASDLQRFAHDGYPINVCAPRIGCGLAGGTWTKVGPIVEETLGHLPVFIYDLP